MTFNEMLSDRINREDLPDNTDCVVLNISIDQGIIGQYLDDFYMLYPSTKEHKCEILNVYLIRGNTMYWNPQEILDAYIKCVRDVWEVYNKDGNKLSIQNHNFNKLLDCTIIEFEEIDIIYIKERSNIIDSTLKDGAELSYKLIYKETKDTYYGNAEYLLEGNVVEITKEYTKRPTENKFKNDMYKEFCTQYNFNKEENYVKE